MTLTERLEKQSRCVLVMLGMLLLSLVAAGDYLTHINYLLEFSPFYLVPVSFFSWFVGKRSGIAFAIASTGIAFLIRLRHIPLAIASWDALVWIALYISTTLIIAQMKGLYDRERRLSRIDPLTKIENRRALLESAARVKNHSDRSGRPLSIAYIDVDGFKELNDRFGHSVGDKLLVLAAAAMRKALRPTDVVARIGGDEFAILLPETNGQSAAHVIGRARFDLDHAMRKRGWSVTFSIGLVSFRPPLDSVAQMLRAADQAMYAAKNTGKNRIEHRDPAA